MCFHKILKYHFALKNDHSACFYIQGTLNNNKISIGNVKFSPFFSFLWIQMHSVMFRKWICLLILFTLGYRGVLREDSGRDLRLIE